MADDADDDARRRAKRERDAASARQRRGKRRREAQAAWSTAQATTAPTGSDVGVGVVVPLEAPLSYLLTSHVRRTALLLDALQRDETTSIAEKARIMCSAIPALARACESTEFRERLDELEKRVGLHRPRGLA